MGVSLLALAKSIYDENNSRFVLFCLFCFCFVLFFFVFFIFIFTRQVLLLALVWKRLAISKQRACFQAILLAAFQFKNLQKIIHKTFFFFSKLIETPEIGVESSIPNLLMNHQKLLFLLIKDHCVVLSKSCWHCQNLFDQLNYWIDWRFP